MGGDHGSHLGGFIGRVGRVLEGLGLEPRNILYKSFYSDSSPNAYPRDIEGLVLVMQKS